MGAKIVSAAVKEASAAVKKSRLAENNFCAVLSHLFAHFPAQQGQVTNFTKIAFGPADPVIAFIVREFIYRASQLQLLFDRQL
jgi:hypothetical protein